MSGLAQHRLQEALAAEHAAVYGYDVVGSHLTGDQQSTAREAGQAHRDRRDALTVKLTGRNLTPDPAAPAYALPHRVSDPDSALRLALILEERTSVVWATGMADLHGGDRRMALEALTDCALRAVGWRQATGTHPVTVPFPGQA
ncbi:MAG: ferritin-like domain-containing protein [Actinocatenispora sp.]